LPPAGEDVRLQVQADALPEPVVPAQHALTSLDLEGTSVRISKLLPFLFLCLCSLVVRHVTSWAPIFFFVGVLLHVQNALDVECKHMERRNIKTVLACGAVSLLHVALLYMMCVFWSIERVFAFERPVATLPDSSPDFLTCMFIVTMTSIFMRFVTHTGDAVIMCLRPLAWKRYLDLCRALCSLYRQLLPMPVWYFYFAAQQGHFALFSELISFAYVALKCSFLLPLLMRLPMLVKATLFQQALYGRYATAAEVVQQGNECSICFGEFQSPIVLPCNHMYCEGCIEEWFVTKRACPICRRITELAAVGTSIGVASHAYIMLDLF